MSSQLVENRAGLFGRWSSSSCKPVILFVVIVAAVIVLALFLLFVLLPSKRVASHSGGTLRELQHGPARKPVNSKPRINS